MHDPCLMRTRPADTVVSGEAGTGMRRYDSSMGVLVTDA